jgi:O-antigen/teichoic acid export membrane protein
MRSILLCETPFVRRQLILYRYLIATIGVERLGIWSVVLATTSASRITELGLTGSVVRFVAKYLASDDHKNASDIVQTAVLSLGGFVGFVLLAAYFPSLWILSRVLPAAAIPQADALLPYALASLWFTTMSGVFLSALDGCQRTDMRALFNTGSSVLTLLASMLLVPKFGLLGLAYGQLGLAGILLVASWICVKLELTELPRIPFRWRRSSRACRKPNRIVFGTCTGAPTDRTHFYRCRCMPGYFP